MPFGIRLTQRDLSQAAFFIDYSTGDSASNSSCTYFKSSLAIFDLMLVIWIYLLARQMQVIGWQTRGRKPSAPSNFQKFYQSPPGRRAENRKALSPVERER